MSLLRRAKARDANELELIAAMKSCGATVRRLDEPCDLLVGYKGLNLLAEVKLPLGPKGGSSHSALTEDQAYFAAVWRGQFATVRSVTDVLNLLATAERMAAALEAAGQVA